MTTIYLQQKPTDYPPILYNPDLIGLWQFNNLNHHLNNTLIYNYVQVFFFYRVNWAQTCSYRNRRQAIKSVYQQTPQKVNHWNNKLTSLHIRYWSIAHTVGTWVLSSCDSRTRLLQARAQINLVLPTAVSPTTTHFTNSWWGCSLSIITSDSSSTALSTGQLST